MKKIYSKPVFYAEQYFFSDSIASCGYQVDPNRPVNIQFGTNVCGVGDGGHKYGNKGGIYNWDISDGTQDFVTATLFATTTTECTFGWDYNKNIVYSPGKTTQLGTFAQAFYGNSANEDNHAPGYDGAAFFS